MEGRKKEIAKKRRKRRLDDGINSCKAENDRTERLTGREWEKNRFMGTAGMACGGFSCGIAEGVGKSPQHRRESRKP